MHIPDGFLNMATAAGTYVVTAGGVSNAVRITRRSLGERQVPLMGVLAAFIFAAQMLNFPVAGGTSGHVIGAALAAILVGPWAAVLIMTAVLAAQCLIFQDGGLLALGANILNMGFIAPFAGYYAYRLVKLLFRNSRRATAAGGFIAGWLSVFLASVACALELAVSGVTPLHLVLPAMAGIHSIIGAGEGLITSAVLGLVMAARPDLLQPRRAEQ